MGLFDDQVSALQGYLEKQLRAGRIRTLDPVEPWPEGRSLVLQEDTGLELGNPAVGSLSFLVWSDTGPSPPPASRVLLLGPDIPELARSPGPRGVALGQAVRVRGRFDEDYNRYLDVKEALYAISPDGLTIRSMPSQQQLWCRLHRDAVEGGFSLAHLGQALITSLGRLDFVAQVDILFHTAGPEDLDTLSHIGQEAGRKVGALIKRNEEDLAECDECEYSDICDEQEHRS